MTEKPASPTVDDAVALLLDPQYRTAAGTRAELRAQGLAEVSGTRVLNELQALGAPSREAALDLAHAALERVGGRDVSFWQESRGRRPNRRVARATRVEVFVVPFDG
jgi:hypothetical protein